MSRAKTMIRSRHNHERMDESSVKSSLDKLDAAIDKIHSRNASQLSFEELYRTAYNLVVERHGEALYRRIEKSLREHLRKQHDKLKQVSDPFLLESLASMWEDHVRSMSMIRDVLMYLDRSWVQMQPDMLPVYDRGSSLFLHEIVQSTDLAKRIVSLHLDHLHRKRKGELVDTKAIRTSYRMLVDLGGRSRKVVEELFETPFLHATEEYYGQMSLEALDNMTAPNYLQFAAKKLEEERKLAEIVFPDLQSKLNKVVQKELITKHSKTILEMRGSGFISMIQENMVDNLGLLFVLFEAAIGSSALLDSAQMLQQFIQSSGESIVQNPFSGDGEESSGVSLSQAAVSVVTSLIQEKDKYDNLVRNSFNNHKSFQKATKEAFEGFMNQNVKCAHFLAIFTDELLSGKVKESNDNIESVLDKVVGLFRFLSDKDVFESYAKQHLAKRLLNQKSISQDFERTMIAKLKNECGHQFTSKMEGMFKDMALSTDASQKFKASGLAMGMDLEFNISVLTSGFWPSTVHYQDESTIRLAPDLVGTRDQFETFYLDSHSGRKLSWNYALGTCDIKVTGYVGGDSYEFTVSPLQTIAMLLFRNGRLQITFKEILEETGIPLEDLKRHMISMSLPRYQLFNKTGKRKEFLDEDVYEFNLEYKSKLKKIKVPLVTINSDLGNKESGTATIPPAVVESRRHMIDATIVRVMKARKKLEHTMLFSEVMKQLRFSPTPQELKQRIESLIEREYLERDATDIRSYVYLA